MPASVSAKPVASFETGWVTDQITEVTNPVDSVEGERQLPGARWLTEVGSEGKIPEGWVETHSPVREHVSAQDPEENRVRVLRSSAVRELIWRPGRG